MFSLVTALVSPCVIELLAHKKEALVASLQENASVVCSHPADSVCLLQGEWDNVKKAYAIVEEFYLRAQAESVVRRMMKLEPGSDARSDFSSGPTNVIGGRIPPDQVLSMLLSPPPTDEGEQSGVGKPSNDSSRHSPKQSGSLSPDTQSSVAHQQRMYAFSQWSAVNGVATTAASTSSELQRSAAGLLCRSHDDSPPILSREGNVDEISDESDTSESQHEVVVVRPGTGGTVGLQRQCQAESTVVSHVNGPREAPTSADTDDAARSATAAGSTANFPPHPDHVNLVSSSRRLDHGHPASAAGGPGRGQLFAGGGSEFFGGQSCHHAAVPESDGAVARLPQIASLFSGVGSSSGGGALSAAAAAAAWPYAELYSAHLSAMRSICESTVKRESGAVDPAAYNPDRGRTTAMTAGPVGGGYRLEDDPLAPEMRCSRCDKTYRSEARMREHARTHDAGYVAVLHACPKCGKAFTYRHNMVVHLRRFHYGWQPAKRHACRTCGMRFQKPYLLRLHERKAHVPSQLDSGVALHR